MADNITLDQRKDVIHHFKEKIRQYARDADQTKSTTLQTSPYGRVVEKVKSSSLLTVVTSKKQQSHSKLSSKKSVETVYEPVQDYAVRGLNILFIGINPGLESSRRGLVARPVKPEEDVSLPSEHQLGIINYVARPTRSSSDLSSEEYNKARPLINIRLQELRPRIACFVGKGIYENWTKSKCQEFGVQNDYTYTDADSSITEKGRESIKIFCMPSTSARTVAYQQKDKLKYFIALKELHDRVMKAEALETPVC